MWYSSSTIVASSITTQSGFGQLVDKEIIVSNISVETLRFAYIYSVFGLYIYSIYYSLYI